MYLLLLWQGDIIDLGDAVTLRITMRATNMMLKRKQP
jgi:hypothetical protein